MANYNVTQCVTNQQYVISASTLSPGDVIVFSIGEDLDICGVVEGETFSTPHDGLYQDIFLSCCDCLTATIDVYGFRFSGCNDGDVYDINPTNFCEEYGIPTTGETYEIQYGSNPSFCATFVDLVSSSGETNYSFVSGPFLTCEECGEEPEPPRSANTENFICIPDCEFTGSTAVTPPHPVWTDGYGTPVTQLNMVVLGGPNGLNA